ncbi:MAG: YdcF family protein [Alphaproteobacteria bacterium]
MRKIFYLISLSSVVLIFGLIGFIAEIQKYKQPKLTSVDVAVVLTGGAGRMDKGIEILKTGKVKKLFISGVHKSFAIRRLMKEVKQNKSAYNKIVLGYQAQTTFDNGLEVAEFINKNNYKSIYLITNSFHMPRSIREVRHRLPNVKIIPYPVDNKNIKVNEWYLYPGTLFILTVEYVKNLVVIARTSIF